MEIIKADLTAILKDYREWDFVVRRKYLNYASKLINEQKTVTYKGIDYRHVEDLKVDLEAECFEESEK